MPSLQANISRNLKALMKSHGHNRKTLSKKSGVSERTISTMVKEDSEISTTILNIEKIASAYGIQGSELCSDNMDIAINIRKNSDIAVLIKHFFECGPYSRMSLIRFAKSESSAEKEESPTQSKA